ncbi:MAG: hypothetical protein VB110_09385 [Bacteroidales bacterium]|nr:hypothetical protein [Bacteroidales bacterium]
MSVNAQLKVATDGKVAVGGTITTYGGLQINKDGYANGLAICTAKKKGLESKYSGMGDRRKDTTHILDLYSGLGQISIINYQTYRILALFVIASHSYLVKQLQVNTVNDFVPVEGSVFHKPVKDIFPARYQLEKA